MRILGSLLVLTTLAFANLKVYLEHNPIFFGEPARLHIVASGDEIVLPKLDKIGPYPISGIAKSESVVNAGGKLEVKKEEIVTFYPDRNVTIPSISVMIDGQEVKSEPIELVVKKAKKSDEIRFELRLSKKEAYVGEPIVAQLVLKIRRTLNIVDYDFVPPKFENFWVKQIKQSSRYLEEHGNYLIKRIRFLLFPQKSGVLKIAPAIFKYAIPDRTTDMFGFSITAPRWHTVLSNGAEVIAKPLPEPVDLVGDFNLSVKVDKRSVQANEPVNLTITIEGVGNVENLEKVELNISDATVYEDKPKVVERFDNGVLHAKWTQKFSIISSRSFVIPALHFRYFSLKEKKIETLTSEPIQISVHGAAIVPNPKPKEISPPQKPLSHEPSSQSGWIWFVAGLLSGGVLVGLGMVLWRRVRGKKTLSIDSRRALLLKLLPHVSKDPKIASLAEALYKEIYEGERKRIKKKEIEEALKDLV